ncbi:uncharacterized protein LOC134234884 [Saccostrea cucullata]|uniref:uncharacterized protein LOC134234884 n=1 Tax=Saccostrea cuccullata TaxID=36930 RepID=UPI002ED50A6B
MDHNMDDVKRLSVCIIGHSFVSRLQRYMDSNSSLMNLNLDSDNFNVWVCARGGLRVSQLKDFIKFKNKPHVCFIQIGENDILRYEMEKLSTDILSIASYLHEGMDIPVVIVGQLLRRQPWASSSDFNAKIVAANNFLKAGCSDLEGVHFWHHRGFWSDLNFLCYDGVHLQCPGSPVHVVSSSPMHRYWRSIRSAILH